MSALPTLKRTANVSDTVAYKKMLNPYPESLPDSVSQQWNNRMSDFLNLFIKHSDFVSRVTAWGVSDGDSWKNGFPVRGRKDYALLFDRDYQLWGTERNGLTMDSTKRRISPLFIGVSER